MKNLKKTTAILAASTMLISSAYANTTNKNIAIGHKIGTQGIGIEGRMPITENLFGRVGVNHISLYTKKHNLKSEHWTMTLPVGVTFQGNQSLLASSKASLTSAPIMLDWHPDSNSGFRLSTGIAYYNHEYNYNTVIKSSVDGLGSLTQESTTLKVKSKPIAAILTAGYDDSFINNSNWSWNCEVGALFSGAPKVSSKVNTISILPISADLEKTRDREISKEIKNKKKLIKIYPVLSFGFKYSF